MEYLPKCSGVYSDGESTEVQKCGVGWLNQSAGMHDCCQRTRGARLVIGSDGLGDKLLDVDWGAQ
jgi:hypothetical protein